MIVLYSSLLVQCFTCQALLQRLQTMFQFFKTDTRSSREQCVTREWKYGIASQHSGLLLKHGVKIAIDTCMCTHTLQA